jgi:hypothetical protein
MSPDPGSCSREIELVQSLHDQDDRAAITQRLLYFKTLITFVDAGDFKRGGRSSPDQNLIVAGNHLLCTGSEPQSGSTHAFMQFSGLKRSPAIFVMSDPSAFMVKMSALCNESPPWKAIFVPSGE